MTDRGSIVIGWLTKLVVMFTLLGFLAFDGFTLVVANFGAADDAATAANAAADTYKTTKNLQSAYNAAVASIAGKGDVVETDTFTIAQDGTVTLTVEREPTTLWVHRIGALKSWVKVRQTGSGTPGG